jgi:hypothetical protein
MEFGQTKFALASLRQAEYGNQEQHTKFRVLYRADLCVRHQPVWAVEKRPPEYQ